VPKHGARRLLLAFVAGIGVIVPAVALAATGRATTGHPAASASALETRIDAGPIGPSASASPSFAFSSTLDSATFECSVDGAPFASCASPQGYTELPDGRHTFRVRALDTTGRADPTPASRTFDVDTAAPGVTIDSGPAGPSKDPLPTFTFTSTDPSASLACALGESQPAFGPCLDDGTYRPATPLPDGSYDFSVQATDPAGNATITDREFSVDTEAPQVTVESGPSGRTDATRPTFGFASPEDSATFACSIDSGEPSFMPCTADDSDRPATPLEPGAYTFRVRASDAAGNTAVATRGFDVEAPKPADKQADFVSSAPQPVPAWYMTARSERDLKRQARNDICAFARRQPNKTRVLLMDFGKAVRRGGVFGAQLRTGAHFSNVDVLDAMKAAADAYRTNGRCYSRGSVRITYGNTNNMPNWMSRRNIRKAGRKQSRMSHRLEKYQRRKGRRYRHQGVAVASDIEPQWNRPKATKALVSGAIFKARGGLYYNYGAASQCPPETSACANRWSIRNLGQVSYGGVKRALPEIYRPVHARQWTRVRKRWNHHHGHDHYCFSGTTATPGFALSAKEGWAKLRARNRCVQRELVNIQEQ
jgi:hypothetical protein